MLNSYKGIKPYLYILLGNSTGTLIQFLLLPVLTRQYSQEDFAIYAVVISWSMVTFLFSTCRYDTPILQATNPNEVASLNAFCAFGGLTVSIVSIILLYSGVLSIENTEMSLMLATLISCSFIGYAFVEVVCKNLIYNEQYKEVGVIRSLTTILTASLQIVISYLFISGEGLIVARVMALLLVLLLSFWFLKKITPISTLVSLNLSSNITTYKKYIKFPKLDLPTGILNYVSSNLPYLYVPFYYGLVPEMGLYALVSRVFQGPMNLLRNSIKNVFHKEATKRFENDVFPFGYLLKTILIISVLCLPFAFLIIVFGELIFSIVFSTEWATAGALASYGALFFITLLLRSPVQCALQVIQCQSISFKLEIIDIITKILFTTFTVWYVWDVLPWIKGFFIIATVNNILNIIVSIYIVRKFNLAPKESV